MMPKYFVLVVGRIVMLGSLSGGLSAVWLLCAKLMSASLVYSKGELCFSARLMAPSSLVIISLSFSCASSKVFADADMMALST